jgi:hypothetical protein
LGSQAAPNSSGTLTVGSCGTYENGIQRTNSPSLSIDGNGLSGVPQCYYHQGEVVVYRGGAVSITNGGILYNDSGHRFNSVLVSLRDESDPNCANESRVSPRLTVIGSAGSSRSTIRPPLDRNDDIIVDSTGGDLSFERAELPGEIHAWSGKVELNDVSKLIDLDLGVEVTGSVRDVSVPNLGLGPGDYSGLKPSKLSGSLRSVSLQNLEITGRYLINLFPGDRCSVSDSREIAFAANIRDCKPSTPTRGASDSRPLVLTASGAPLTEDYDFCGIGIHTVRTTRRAWELHASGQTELHLRGDFEGVSASDDARLFFRNSSSAAGWQATDGNATISFSNGLIAPVADVSEVYARGQARQEILDSTIKVPVLVEGTSCVRIVNTAFSGEDVAHRTVTAANGAKVFIYSCGNPSRQPAAQVGDGVLINVDPTAEGCPSSHLVRRPMSEWAVTRCPQPASLSARIE